MRGERRWTSGALPMSTVRIATKSAQSAWPKPSGTINDRLAFRYDKIRHDAPAYCENPLSKVTTVKSPDWAKAAR